MMLSKDLTYLEVLEVHCNRIVCLPCELSEHLDIARCTNAKSDYLESWQDNKDW